MEPILVAVVAACSAIGGTAASRAVDLFFAKRAGVGPLVAETDAARRELIETLEQTAAARGDRIAVLEAELEAERAARGAEVEALNKRVARLETALSLALDKLAENGQTITLPPLD